MTPIKVVPTGKTREIPRDELREVGGGCTLSWTNNPGINRACEHVPDHVTLPPGAGGGGGGGFRG